MLAEIKRFYFIVRKYPHPRLLARLLAVIHDALLLFNSRRVRLLHAADSTRLFNPRSLPAAFSIWQPSSPITRTFPRAWTTLLVVMLASPSVPAACPQLYSCSAWKKVLGSARLLWLPPTCLDSLSQFILVGFAPCLGVVVSHNDSFHNSVCSFCSLSLPHMLTQVQPWTKSLLKN